MANESDDRFLRRLHADRAVAEEQVKRLSRKIRGFLVWNQCPSVDDCIQEIFARVVRLVAQGKNIHNIEHFCFGVARNVLKESFRERQKAQLFTSDEIDQIAEPLPDDNPTLIALRDCLSELSEEERELILTYYGGTVEIKSKVIRKALLDELGISSAALRKRVYVIRQRLEDCVSGKKQ